MAAAAKTRPEAEDSADAEPRKAVLHVFDSTATPAYPSRTHDLRINGDIRPITFKYGEPLELDADIALQFLNIPEFIVTDPTTGDRFEPPPSAPAEGQGVHLRPDEVVARLHELTTEALVLRAKSLPGGTNLAMRASREEVMTFLMDRVTRSLARAADPAARRVYDAEGLSAGAYVAGPATKQDLDRLFGDID